MQTTVPGIYAIGAARADYAGMLMDAVADAQAASNAIATN
jgi:thioredoxin reductase